MAQFLNLTPYAMMWINFVIVLLLGLSLLAAIRYRNNFFLMKFKYEEKVKTIELLEGAVHQSTLDGQLLSVTPALLQQEGFETEAVYRTSSLSNSKDCYVDPKRQEEFFSELRKHGKVTNFVSEVYWGEIKEHRWASENARIIYNPKTGKPSHYEGTIRDITDTVALETALAENKLSKERFKAFAETNTDWFWEMDRELRFCYFSETFEAVTGVYPEKLLGKTRQETGIPNVEQEVFQTHLEILDARRPFRDFIHPRTKKDGTVVWLAISGNPVFDADGSFAGYLGSGRDITEAKTRELELVAAQQRNEEASVLLDEAINAMPHGMLIHDQDKIQRANLNLHEILDIPVELVSPGSSLRKYVRYLLERGDQGDIDVEEALSLSDDMCANGKSFSLERILPDGRIVVSYIVPRKNGGMVSVLTDVTEDRKREIELEKSRNLLTDLANNLPTGLFQVVRNLDGTFHCPYLSQRFREIFGIGKNNNIDPIEYMKHIHPEDLRAYLESLKVSGKTVQPWQQEFRLCTMNTKGCEKTRKYEWFRLSAKPEKRPDGSILWHGYVANITEQKNDESKIEQLAYYDSLTGLSNRDYFIQEMESRLSSKRRTCGHAAICFVDVDNFKLLNDSHGHDVGDKLLQAMAERIKDNLRSYDLIGRFGGDEFVFLLDRLGCDIEKAREKAGTRAQNILKEIRRGFHIGEIDCPTTISIGVTMFNPEQSFKTSDLLKSADIAMYETKRSGRNNVTFYNMQTQKTVMDTYNLQRDLQCAVKENQLELEIQPQVNRVGKILSGEALIRWNHPQRGRVMPIEFISLAEQTGQISLINNWVLKESIKLLSKWRDDPALKDMVIGVNISPRQILDIKFCAKVKSLFDEYHVHPNKLMIELTEHVMARNPDQVAQNMHELKGIGVRFSLDDFGTGYSSLSQLRQFPFDELKIDGSFIADVAKERNVQSLVSAIMGMAKALEMHTVAEHVTSSDQFDFLTSIGCEYFQGYMFSRSLPVGDFETFVRAHKPKLFEPSNQCLKQA